MDDENLLCLVDVGALGGLQSKWLPYVDKMFPVLFEPNRAQARIIEKHAAAYPRSLIIQKALAHVSGPRELFVTQNPNCVSLLEPNFDLLRGYGIKVHFDVVGREIIECERYDKLFVEGVAPAPDAIKIDAQGFEYEVLLGFGELLHHCLGIEVEAHFYPLYRGQRLLDEIIDLLAAFDFVLRRIDVNKLDNFDGDVVEVDAYFTKGRRLIASLPEQRQSKFHLISEVWGLQAYRTP